MGRAHWGGNGLATKVSGFACRHATGAGLTLWASGMSAERLDGGWLTLALLSAAFRLLPKTGSSMEVLRAEEGGLMVRLAA